MVHRLDVLRDQCKGIIPANRLVVIGFRVVAQWMGQTALILQEIVTLGIERCHAVLSEKVAVDHAACRFPGHRFSAVFAEAEGTFIVITPGAARTVKTACFVHAHQVAHIFQGRFAVKNETRGGFQ